MPTLKPTHWCKLLLGIILLVANTFAKQSFREIQVLKALEKFNDEHTGSTGGGLLVPAAGDFVPPAVYSQSVNVCLIFYWSLWRAVPRATIYFSMAVILATCRPFRIPKQ